MAMRRLPVYIFIAFKFFLCSVGQECKVEDYEKVASGLRELKHRSQAGTSSSPSSSHSIRQPQPHQNRLDLSHLNQILEYSEEDALLRVQTKVTMEDLVNFTVTKNRIPLVVPEFPQITVGGAIVGGALESSSFRYGQFSDTIKECVVLLGNGTLLTVDNTSELFQALPGSHGSLGLVLEATVKLQNLPPRPVVEVNTVRVNFETLWKYTQSACYDFIDALALPNSDILVVLGQLRARNYQDKYFQLSSRGPWFYEYIQDEKDTFIMPVRDYLFRYDYGAFWMARPLQWSWKALRSEPKLTMPFLLASPPMRPIMGPLYSTSNLFRLLHTAHFRATSQRFVILDAYIPASQALRYLKFVRQRIPVSIPIWLCPVRATQQPLSPSGSYGKEEMLINVAVWGRVADNRGEEYVKLMEESLLKHGGRKMLYSPTTMSAQELYRHHINGSAYDILKAKYDSGNIFPHLHTKLGLKGEEEAESDDYTRSWHYRFSRLLM